LRLLSYLHRIFAPQQLFGEIMTLLVWSNRLALCAVAFAGVAVSFSAQGANSGASAELRTAAINNAVEVLIEIFQIHDITRA